MKAVVPRFSLPALGCSFRLLLLLVLAAVAFGCKPDIGDKCTTSTDCSIAGERLCDLTQPGGYCTIFNCEPNLCPENSVCVAFGERTCSVQAVTLRFRRTFCMASCEKDNDCRGDAYRCVDISTDTSRRVVDTNPESHRVCGIPAAYDVPSVSPNPAVCYPSDASFDVSRPEAGPPAVPDANGSDTPMSDRAGDGADAALADRPIDMAADGLDSSRVETGADIEPDVTDPDVTDEETGTSDAPDESTVDAVTPADADGQADAGPADASADVSAD